MSLNHAVRHGLLTLVAMAMVTLRAAPVSAQEPADPKPGKITFAGGIDLRNAYMFRGIRQDDTGAIGWPYGDLGLGVYSGDGGLKSVGVHVGTWNSLHTGLAGSDGPSGKRWYESRFNATLGLTFGGGVSFGTTYTAYMSPNDMFTTVKEMAFKLAVDDRAALGRAVKPYALVAFELGTKPGVGQVDGGLNAGKYLELGVAPTYAARRAKVAFPVKLGLSLGDYYELAGKDNRFGYVSVAGIVTVPLGGKTRFGAWKLHGGLEYQALGDMTKAINGGDGSKLIGSIGIGFSY